MQKLRHEDNNFQYYSGIRPFIYATIFPEAMECGVTLTAFTRAIF